MYINLSLPRPFKLRHTYLVVISRLKLRDNLSRSPALHSVVRFWYESPSGASTAQFLFVRLFGYFSLTPLPCAWIEEEFSDDVSTRLPHHGLVADGAPWRGLTKTLWNVGRTRRICWHFLYYSTCLETRPRAVGEVISTQNAYTVDVDSLVSRAMFSPRAVLSWCRRRRVKP